MLHSRAALEERGEYCAFVVEWMPKAATKNTLQDMSLATTDYNTPVITAHSSIT